MPISSPLFAGTALQILQNPTSLSQSIAPDFNSISLYSLATDTASFSIKHNNPPRFGAGAKLSWKDLPNRLQKELQPYVDMEIKKENQGQEVDKARLAEIKQAGVTQPAVELTAA